MSYGKLFYGKADGVDVALWLKNYAGTGYELKLTEARIRWTGADNGIHELISTSRGSATFILEHGVHKSFALSVVYKQERDYVLQIGDWYGTVLQDQCQFDDSHIWFFEVHAVDGLGENRTITAEEPYPMGTLAYWTWHLLKKLANDMRPLKVRVASNLVAANASGTQTFFNTALFGANGWAGKFEKDGKFVWSTARHALEQICYSLGLRLFYADDFYYFIQADKWNETNLTFIEFTNPSRLATGGFTVVDIDRKVDPVRLSGGTFSYRPELKEISQRLESDSSNVMFEAARVPPSNSFNMSFERYDGIDSYTVAFTFRGRFTNINQVGLIWIRLYIRSNNLIFTNAGTWVANGFHDNFTGYWLDPNLIDEWAEFSFSVNVNNLPSTLPTEIRYEVHVLNLSNLPITFNLSNAEADVRVVADLDNKSIEIEIADNSSWSSVILALQPTAINVFASEFTSVRPRVWTGSVWVAASTVWPTDSLHRTVLEHIFSFYDRPVEIYEGEIWREYVSPLNIVEFDGVNYLVLDCERDYKERTSKVTLFRDTRDTRTVTATELPIGDEPPLVGGRGFEPGNIGMQGVTAAVIKNITGTTVEVFSVPVNFEPGTNLILANPYSGQTENVVVQEQNETNITMTSAPSGSYPQGSVLIITPIEVLRLLSN